MPEEDPERLLHRFINYEIKIDLEGTIATVFSI